MTAQYSLKLEFIPMPPSCYVNNQSQQDDEISSTDEEDTQFLLWGETKRDTTECTIVQNNDGHENDNRNHTRHGHALIIDDSSSVEEDSRAPMMKEVLEELRSTDNIFATEIGRYNMVHFLRTILTSNATYRRIQYGTRECDCNYWDFQDERGYHYLMEILQANIIYFLKYRHYDQERGRYYPRSSNAAEEVNCWAEDNVIQDFLSVFTKAASSRYFPSRKAIIDCCFGDEPRARNRIDITTSTTLSTKIKRALVRLHRRAGIYLPHSKQTENHHEYWIALWWICSCLLVWILEPCVEVTRLVDHRICRCQVKGERSYSTSSSGNGHLFTSLPKKRCRLTNGFAQHSQSYIVKIPLELIRRQILKVGMPYERVLMHDGPWTNEDDDDTDYIDVTTASADTRITRGDDTFYLDSDDEEAEVSDNDGQDDDRGNDSE